MCKCKRFTDHPVDAVESDWKSDSLWERRFDDWRDYRLIRHKFKIGVQNQQSKSWKSYSSSIETESETSRLKKLLASDQQTKLGTLRKEDGTYTESEQEQFELLLKTHFPGCSINTNTNWIDEALQTPMASDWEYARLIVTEESVTWAISTFQPYKSPGTDGILPALLQWGLHSIIGFLIKIYRGCLAWKFIPTIWRDVKVIFLPKPGKTDYTQPKSFRPISLTSFLLKTLERLCDRHIRCGPLTINPIHKNQHAYQTGKSTETALHQVVHKIECALESKQSCLITFIDIEGAFDKTTFPSIRQGLKARRVNDKMIDWITQMLSKRAVRVDMSTSTRCLVTKGCPQGGVLSPLLWVVVVNDLIIELNKNGLHTIGYADDLAIMVSGLFESTLCDKMQWALRTVETWCTKHSLSVNPQKTEMVLFSKKNKLNDLRIPKLFGMQLTLSKEVKYLGIWLDSKLLWGKHLDHVVTKGTNTLWQCRRAVGKDWGLNPRLCRWLYTMIVRPVLTYSSIVWWQRTNLVTSINKLQQLQRLACSFISSCSKTTPSAALDIILGLPPLHLHIQKEAMAAALRLKSTNQWQGSGCPTNHCKILDRALRAAPEAMKGMDKIANSYMMKKEYKLSPLQREVDNRKHNITIFTDGAKNKTGTGCGYFSPELGLSKARPLGNTTTVLQAEVTGITLAAKHVNKMDMDDHDTNITIYTDSASAVSALGKQVTRSKSVAECHKALQELSSKYTVTIQWIKGHNGCEESEKADSLAKLGAHLNPTVADSLLCRPTTTVIKELLNAYTQGEHFKAWTKRTDCKQSRSMFPHWDTKLTTKILKLERDDLRDLVGIITGHCNLNKHLVNTGATDSPLCRGCMQEEETVEHVLLHCPTTKDTRLDTGVLSIIESAFPPAAALHRCCQRPRTLLRYFRELGWLS